MDEEVSNWSKTQAAYERSVEDKISQFSANECTSFDNKFPEFFDLYKRVKTDEDNFLKQFTEFVPTFDPKFHSDKILQDFNREFKANDKNDIINFLKKQIDTVKWKNQIVFDRYNSENVYPKYTDQFERYFKSASKFLEECECAIINLQTEQADPKSVELAIRYDLLEYYRNFSIKNLYYLFKQFPLLRRHEILEIAVNRYIDDTERELNNEYIPSVIEDPTIFSQNLERLAKNLHIEFDINEHDGQHFNYLCEKLYEKSLLMNLKCNNVDEELKPVDDPTMLDRLNYNFIIKAQIDAGLKLSLKTILEPDVKGNNINIQKFETHVLKKLTKDKVTSYLRLQFSQCKILINSVVDSLIELDKLQTDVLIQPENTDNKEKEIRLVKNDDEHNSNMELTFVEEQFSIFKKYLLVATSTVKSKAKGANIDNEALLELALSIFDEFYKKKVFIINSLLEIKRNVPNIKEKISLIAKKIYDFRPNLLSGVHDSCITPLKLSLDILEIISTTIQTFSNLQILINDLSSTIGKDLFHWFEFPNTQKQYQFNNKQFPYSNLHIFTCLSKIPDFFDTAQFIANEIITSFSIRSLKFFDYFYYAVWVQLLNESNKSITNSTPETYEFNMRMSDMVGQAMTSRLLNDLDLIHEEIYKQDKEKQYKYALNLRTMLQLTIKLRKYLIKSDSLLSIYQRQVQSMSKADIKDVIDLAYGSFNFSEINDEWSPDELIKVVKAQFNFVNAASIAVRYNNYADDASYILQFFQMNDPSEGFATRPTKAMVQRRNILRGAPTILFYESKIIKESDFSNIFCNLSEANDINFSESDKLISLFMPYCYKSEIAYICGYERCFLLHYTTTDAFLLFSPNKYDPLKLLDENDKLEHFYVPTYCQALSLSNSMNALQKALRYVFLRLQLLQYIRHDSYITTSKPRTIENFYNETLLFASPFFSKMSVDIKKQEDFHNLDFSIEYLNVERLTFCSKQFLTAFILYENAIIPSDAILYTLDSIKSYIGSMMEPLYGRPYFLTLSLYSPKYLNQFWHQCNEGLRAEFLSKQSTIEQKVDDSIVGYDDSNYRINAYKFSLNLVRLTLLKLGYYELVDCKDPRKVTLRSAINNINKHKYKKGKASYDSNVNVKSTTRIGRRPQEGTIETAILSSRTAVLIVHIIELSDEMLKNIYEKQFEEVNSILEQTFKAPNNSLKPDCYSKKIKISTTRTIYLPTISSIKEQFRQEVGYARSRFCHAMQHMINSSKREIGIAESNSSKGENYEPVKANKMLSLNLTDMESELKLISDMLNSYVSASESKLILTWSGYLANVLKENFSRQENQGYLNMQVNNFLGRFRKSMSYHLADLHTAMYNKLAEIRDHEKHKNKDQHRFEKQVTREIKAEYELLLRDLQTEIDKMKEKYVQSERYLYGNAYTSINRFLMNQKFMDNITNKEITDQLLSEPIEIRDPEIRKRVKALQEQARVRALAEGNTDESSLLPKKKTVQEKIEETKEQIEEMQILRKKLRISTTLSNIAFKRIYSKLIAKVAEEKKEYSTFLFQAQSSSEESFEALNKELREAYHKLTEAEINIEDAKQEIEEIKKDNTKLIHWKETTLRAADGIHKELRRIGQEIHGDINVSQVLAQIQEKSDELEMLDYETQQLEQQIDLEVRAPMAQLDYVKREITRRMGARVKFPERPQTTRWYQRTNPSQSPRSRQSQQSRQSMQSIHSQQSQRSRQSQQSQRSRRSINSQQDLMPEAQQQQETSEIIEPRQVPEPVESQETGTTDNEEEVLEKEHEVHEPDQFPVREPDEYPVHEPFAETDTIDFEKLQELIIENNKLREDNDDLREQIARLEESFSSLPPTQVPMLTELVESTNRAAVRAVSTRNAKKIVRPGTSKSNAGNYRPATTRV